MRIDRAVLLALSLVLVVGCATRVPLRVQDFGSGDERIEISRTAFFPSAERASAAAALATLLYTSGLEAIGPAQVAPLFGARTPAPNLRTEMVAIARRQQRLPFVLPPTLDALFAEVRAGQPALILQKLDGWRYSVVIGVEPASNRVILRSGKEGRVYQDVETFIEAWKSGDNWALVLGDGSRPPVSATLDAWVATLEAATAAGHGALAEKGAYGAIGRWPEEVVPWVALGNVRYAMKAWPGAQEAYVEALRMKPENPVVRNNLALVLLERRCIALAEQELERAVAGETDAALLKAYENTRALINRYSGPAIYCPSPEDGVAPTEYEIAPLNPETPRGRKARR